MKISALRKHGKGYVVFMGLRNVTVDICRAFSGSVQFVVLDMILEDVKRYSNLFHPCPFAVNDYIYSEYVRYFLCG